MKFIRWLMALFLIYAAGSQAGVILLYHHISDTTPAATSTSPARFARQLAYLQREGIAVRPLSEILQRRDISPETPEVAITFDDGYLDIYREAMPLLAQYHFPYTVFINTAAVGAPGYMSWAQLRQLKSAGASIANHTVSHPHLVRRRPGEDHALWQSRIRREIEEAQTAIERHLGTAPRFLAYPYGEFNSEVLSLTAGLGYIGLAQHSGVFGATSHRQRVPRFAMGGRYGAMEDFAVKVQALHMPVAREGIRQQEEAYIARAGQRPVIFLRLARPGLVDRLNCFYQGQALETIVLDEFEVEFALPADLSPGRTRVNCTAKAEASARYYWHSYPLFVQGADGQWRHSD